MAEVARSGFPVRYVGSCEGGEVGACYVTAAHGRDLVLTWWPGSDARLRVSRVQRVLDAVIARGYPAPRYVEVIDVADGVVVLQERVIGDHVTHVPERLAATLVELNEARRRVFDEPSGSVADLFLLEDGPGFCLHEPMRRHSPDTAGLLAWVESVGRSLPSGIASGRDAVHGDYHPGNVLLRPGTTDEVAGVVDWTGAYVGDAGKDLVDLAFSCDRRTATRDARAYVQEVVLQSLDADRLAAFCAHQSLRMVDWSIRHLTSADVDAWVDVSLRWRKLADSF